MSKIIGARIRENFKYQREDGTEGTLNSVDFRCITPAIGDDNVGNDVCRYTAQIPDLKYIFKDYDEAMPLRDFVESIIGKECILETKSQQSKFGVVDKLVQVHFLK
ncbi:MAG: hypothetical protein IJX02_08140 [Clostridia bacterium]|nr:hypothetical protein [Clostridia bacterium]